MTTQPRYQVLFYVKASGECPTDDFLDTMPVKARAKLEKWIELLEEEGPDLPRPYADVLRGKVRELRVKFGPAHYRALYFFMGKRIVITHGFIKRTDKVPETEIERALAAMKDFYQGTAEGDVLV